MSSGTDAFPRAGPLVRGYDARQVDHFVTRVLQTLNEAADAREPVTATEARHVVFRRALGGYAPDAVDQALDDLAEQLPE